MPDRPRLGPQPMRSARDEPALSVQRAAVLEAVQTQPEPVTTAALSAACGLHGNTLREHLDALVHRGLVVRGHAPSTGRGRPAVTYASAARVEPDPRVREYTGLATALAGHLARTSQHPSADARTAGRAWGAELLDSEPDQTRPTDDRAARARVVGIFDTLGFDPEADGDASTVALRRCPLLDAAQRYPEVVCAVHQGVAEGLLDGLGADASGVELHAFAEPGACILRLARRPQDEPHTGDKPG